MKKALKSISLIILAIFVAFSFVGCYSGGFLKENGINRLGDKLGLTKNTDGTFVNPTASILLSYEMDNRNYEVYLTYELLFDKAPLTVNNFIALAKSDFYKDTLLDYIGDTFSILGRYKLNETSKFELQKQDFTIKGEFLANGWSVDGTEEGTANALHNMGALGMYHETQTETINNFDKASTAFYMVWTDSFGSSNRFSNHNFAVFAHIKASYVKVTASSLEDFYSRDAANRPGLDSMFVNYIKEADTMTRTDTEGISLTATPSTHIKINGISIGGITGEADTSLRLRNKA